MLKRLNEILGLGSGIIVLVVSLLIVCDILARALLGQPTIWALPVSQYLILVMVFLGTAFCFQEDGHVNVEVVVDRLKPGLKKFLIAAGYLMSTVYVLVMLWSTAKLTFLSFTMSWTTIGSFPVPTSILYSIMVLGSAILLITILLKIRSTFAKSGGKE